ncbi:YozQ family protein [Ectobacillus ponti]|uniref:YozQ family protein n=1 Tax=Ectobacillus ponti TaxID=2961894 RepID=A0AA42BSP2_9BACI|nr:YozQ family protein [Ectobacillus ponti]MCP8970734.1 YozQ family protein [Ectobacillus ponti]
MTKKRQDPHMAEYCFNPLESRGESFVEQAFMETYNQVGDSYMGGTIDAARREQRD